MNFRIILLVTGYFVNIFADQSILTTYNEVYHNTDDDVDDLSQELLIPIKSKSIKVTKPSKPHFDQSNPELVESHIIPDNTNSLTYSLSEEENGQNINFNAKVADSDPVSYSLVDDFGATDEDILNSINDDSISRYRRQSRRQETPGEGSGADFFEETVSTNDNPVFEIKMTVTLQRPVSGGVLSKSDQALYKASFKKQLAKIYKFIPGFRRVSVASVSLDPVTKRPKADFSIFLDGGSIGALGATEEERLKALARVIQDAGNVLETTTNKVLGNEFVSQDYNVANYLTRLINLLDDVCKSNQPCNPGYKCVSNLTAIGDYQGKCLHSCVASNFNNLCQNEAICTLDANSDPYCQCGTGFSGRFCETTDAATAGVLSTPEIIGISVGTLLAIAALASCCAFLLFCRKGVDKDMEYSYYGDENTLMEGYVDQSSSLGISNMYIDRPRITIQPLDIYNNPATQA